MLAGSAFVLACAAIAAFSDYDARPDWAQDGMGKDEAAHYHDDAEQE